ncbi:glucosyl-3-phosphoglycerate synthase [Saxibacter everestensis]|uniref:Glucosyl-3-phosphoglycerate synthase n=1 Tax=Saxibacter everestensis TaxID=2909229 RepID=A0ABY8QUT5_9MICO|nr:glucosyl-3-phosphoglycerate synthase [Brevibacteriaceae bacterium ZFBP1038]
MQTDVGAWFRRRTSSSGQWHRRELVENKNGRRISVVLPAHNEAATVGAIVSLLRSELMEKVPLIDELVVIDSGSSDDTALVAERAGARVFRQDQILPGLEDVPGKGEALWKSLLVTDGDIVAFIDADLRSFDEQFAVGLLGPLLADESVQFVKAFYDRPLVTAETVLPAGGGRVTELVARPLLNLHWPVLSRIVQPLAGEYAARRSLLEQLSFVSGYGVEVGMLIDVVESVGLDTMAQVDLGRREHRNSGDAALGRMAAHIQLAVLSRLQRYGRILLTDEPATLLTQFCREGDSLRPRISEVGIAERPPMISLEEYRQWMAREMT